MGTELVLWSPGQPGHADPGRSDGIEVVVGSPADHGEASNEDDRLAVERKGRFAVFPGPGRQRPGRPTRDGDRVEIARCFAFLAPGEEDVASVRGDEGTLVDLRTEGEPPLIGAVGFHCIEVAFSNEGNRAPVR